MKRLMGLLLVVLSFVTPWPVNEARAQDCYGIQSSLNPIGYEQLTVSTTAVSLTPPNVGSRVVVILIRTNAVRYRDDGTAPTSTVGMPQDAGSVLVVCGASIGKIKLIRSGSADATAEISYYGTGG